MKKREKVIGIYQIKNKINNNVYVGKSIDVGKRLKSHVYSLEKNKHSSPKLQEDYNKFGLDVFEFNILIECDNRDIDRLESLYCYKKNVWGEKGYNVAKLLDYRRFPKTKAVEIKNYFLERLMKNCSKEIHKKGEVRIKLDDISEKLNLVKDQVLIFTREITRKDEEKYKCHFRLTNEFPNCHLTVATYEHWKQKYRKHRVINYLHKF